MMNYNGGKTIRLIKYWFIYHIYCCHFGCKPDIKSWIDDKGKYQMEWNSLTCLRCGLEGAFDD